MTKKNPNKVRQGSRSAARSQSLLQLALDAHARGDLLEAQALCQKVLQSNPREPETLNLLGVVLLHRANYEEAIQLLEKAIALRPHNPDYHFNHGLALQSALKIDEALGAYDQSISHDPNRAEAYLNRGLLLEAKREPTNAIRSYLRAIEINPNYAEAHFNTGCVLLQLKCPQDALDCFIRAISIDPEYSRAHLNMGIALTQLGRFEEALASLEKAIDLSPGNFDCYLNKGFALQELKRLHEAEGVYDHALKIQPTSALVHFNLATLKNDLDSTEAALFHYDRAIALDPTLAEAHSNRGSVLKRMKRIDEAIAAYDRAIELAPNRASYYWNKSLALLLKGNFKLGWALYESRWAVEGSNSREKEISQPLWLGAEDISKKTILLHAEQGLGDAIQFCRYAELVKALGANVVLEVPKSLMALMSSLDGVDYIVERGKPAPEFDYHCPLVTLPVAFRNLIDGIPNKKRYLSVDQSRVLKWKSFLGDDGFKIAICWQGSTGTSIDRGRSFPVQLFEGISKIDGVRLISLQKNFGAEQLDNLPKGMRVERLPEDFDSGPDAFLDSAAILQCVDLVITSDTALTHLAGALGVKTWLALQYVPDWRWMLEGRSTPWYENHRLFRQSSPGDWEGVFTELEVGVRNLTLNIEVMQPRV